MTHTPTPWIDGLGCVRAGNGVMIVDCEVNGIDRRIAYKNSALIVLAANAYPDLTARCDRLAVDLAAMTVANERLVEACKAVVAARLRTLDRRDMENGAVIDELVRVTKLAERALFAAGETE